MSVVCCLTGFMDMAIPTVHGWQWVSPYYFFPGNPIEACLYPSVH